MSQFFVQAGGASGPVTSVTGIAPIQANGVSGVAQTGAVSISITESAIAYTNVTHSMSPYTVLATDDYLSVDSSTGTVTLNFPNAPTALQEWVVKDRTGNSDVSNITITTPGGVKTFDGGTNYVIDDMFESVRIIANPALQGNNYEIF